MARPADCDHEKLAEVAMGMLWLTLHGPNESPRAWKGMDWDLADLLFEKGWIDDPKSKAKSVALTEQGFRLAEALFRKHFGISA